MGSGTTLEYSDISDIGLRRQKNQDSKAVVAPWSREQYRRTGWLFVVADGMGAHAAGETASELAATVVPQAYQRLAPTSPPMALLSSIRQANEVIHSQGEATAELRGMGTTCTALALLPRGAVVGHVGDSRAYRIRGSTIEQFSRDHSLAWEVEAMQARSGEEPVHAPPKNIITRSLGPHAKVVVDVEGPFPIDVDDTFVVCSDGLSGQVADEEIGLLAGTLPPVEAASALLGLALVRGAPDNVTIIVARAGVQEATSASGAETPWPLTTEPAQAKGPQPLPVNWLALAAGALLGALVSANWVAWDRVRDGELPADLAGYLSAGILGLMGLLFLAAMVLAVIRLLPSGAPPPLLQNGKQLGGGPYRSFACPPSLARIEGIISSVESAADGLSDSERQRCLAHVTTARQANVAGDFTGALTAANRGIALYRLAVEAARRDETVNTADD